MEPLDYPLLLAVLSTAENENVTSYAAQVTPSIISISISSLSDSHKGEGN